MSQMEKDNRGGIRVLVIDDEEIVHLSVGKVLSRAGYGCEAVFMANEGLARLRQERFDLVITDLMMPQMTGIELLRVLETEGIEVPVIMITGYPTLNTAMKAMQYGARDYLAKPFTRRELLGPVKRALRQQYEKRGEPDHHDEQDSVDVASLVPGAHFFLPHHAWGEFQQDGHFRIGVEESFLASVGKVAAIAVPKTMEALDQGTVAIRLITAEGEEHGVAMPLSGLVKRTNQLALERPDDLTSDDWVLEILPSQLRDELTNLVRRC